MVNIVNNNPLISIHGNRMLEFRGTIRRIVRERGGANSNSFLNTDTDTGEAE